MSWSFLTPRALAPIAWFAGLTSGVLGQELLDRKDGTAASERLGTVVSGGEDVTGDGVPDYIVIHGTSTATVYSGSDGSVVHTINASFPNVSLAGDLNADGYADFASSYRAYSGLDASELFSINVQCSSAPDSVDGLGDLNGDGYDDLILGAHLFFIDDAGGHAIYSGATGTKLRELCGIVATTEPGSVVRRLGDVDGDGVVDYIFSDLATRDVFVQSGADGSNLADPSGPSLFGAALAGPGDIDADGYADYLIGSPWAAPFGPNSGQAILYSGRTHGILSRYDGTQADQGLGGRVSPAGDVNGDGWPDFLIARARLNIFARPDRSEGVGLYSGRSRQLLYEFVADDVSDLFGGSISEAGDVNGDGYDDILVGAGDASPGGVALAGSLFLYGGSELFLNLAPRTIQAGDTFTRTLAEGVPGNLTLIALVDVNGTPVFVPDGGIGAFDASGFYALANVVPSGFSGLTLTFRGWAVAADGRLITTTPEVVDLP